jgi:hypothetical protein
VVDGGQHVPGAEQQRGPEHRDHRRPASPQQGQQRPAEQQLLGQGGGERDAQREVVDGFGPADVGDAAVVEEPAGCRQRGAHGDPAGRHRGGVKPRAQPGGQVLSADAEVGPTAAGATGKGGEPDGGGEVQGRAGRRRQHPVHGDVVQGQYRHPDRLGRYRRLTHHSPWWSRWWLGLGRAIISRLGQPSDLDQLETQ